MSDDKIIKCPICKQEHLKSFLEITSIGRRKAEDEYSEYDYIYIYCNYSDEGREYVY